MDFTNKSQNRSSSHLKQHNTTELYREIIIIGHYQGKCYSNRPSQSSISQRNDLFI